MHDARTNHDVLSV